MGLGITLVTFGAAGKGAIYFYRAVKAGNAFNNKSAIGAYYHGAFDRDMTRREAA